MNKYLEKIAQIEINPRHKGLLHKKLGVPKSEHISNSKLEETKRKAKESGNVKLLREATFALNSRKWKH